MDFYTVEGAARGRQSPADLPAPPSELLTDPGRYVPDEPLVKAVNVALLLGQPLLLTGDPGTGKTQLAYSVSHALGFGPPLVFETKSTSTARDLFYTYDTIRRFQAAQAGLSAGVNDKDFLTYNALGQAIIYASDPDKSRGALPAGFFYDGPPRRSVVLIDEIDKAPRDFPNDILSEIEHMYFRVAELGNRRLEALPGMRPVVILTSNSERHLPDAFLRRCVYHHIEPPDADKLADIVSKRVGSFAADSRFLKEAIKLFVEVRDMPGLNKSPATAELLGWILYLREGGAQPEDSLHAHAARARTGLSLLVKTKEDLPTVKAKVEETLTAPPPPDAA